ncbi:phage terminase, small subunit, putative, P27 family [Devosia enhydra]|uniref:Phage terminase, small subunit, putative, P27 family n=1 Tax=Devosia enhydra TaxID=665118 RepID=A0A1K2HV33_9HYPH|nr:phage terminase small subunit P27 family [Devosia enhydra]SFZ82431.1 phage terminase, small subunit, putative, P27 family [Devosia enhydra]
MKGQKPQLMVINGSLGQFPPPPAWLAEEAKAEWRRMQPYLEERKALNDIDLANLENYCVAQGRVRECEAAMVGINDIDRKAKLWRMQKQAMDAARVLGGELGLTPMARSRPAFREPSLFDDDEQGEDPTAIA